MVYHVSLGVSLDLARESERELCYVTTFQDPSCSVGFEGILSAETSPRKMVIHEKTDANGVSSSLKNVSPISLSFSRMEKGNSQWSWSCRCNVFGCHQLSNNNYQSQNCRQFSSVSLNITTPGFAMASETSLGKQLCARIAIAKGGSLPLNIDRKSVV